MQHHAQQTRDDRAWRQQHGRALYETVWHANVMLKPSEAETVAQRVGVIIERIRNDEDLRARGITGKSVYDHLLAYYWHNRSDRSKLQKYVKVPESRRRSGGAPKLSTFYIRNAAKHALVLEAIGDQTRWDRYEIYFEVFNGLNSVEGTELGALHGSLTEDYRGFVNRIEDMLQPILQQFDLAGYFREVTRYALVSSATMYAWPVDIDLRPSEAAIDHPWVFDVKGRVSRGYLPMADAERVVSKPLLLLGAIPAIPLCWLPLQSRCYSSGALAFIDRDPWTLTFGSRNDAAVSDESIAQATRRSGAIEVFDVAEVRLAVGPINDRGDPRLMFELVQRVLFRSGDETFIGPGQFDDDAIPDMFGIDTAEFNYVGVSVEDDFKRTCLIGIDDDATERSWGPTGSALDQIMTSSDGVHYLAFDEVNLDALLIEPAQSEVDVTMAFSADFDPYALFPARSAAATLQAALRVDESGTSAVSRALSARIEAHVNALKSYQHRCRVQARRQQV